MAENTCACSVCEKTIYDKGKKSQDSVFCEGTCQAWMHRICCGLPKEAFKKVQDLNEPYLCNYCFREDHKNKLEGQKQEITLLKARICQLESMVVPVSGPLDSIQKNQTTPYAQTVKNHTRPSSNHTRSSYQGNPISTHSQNYERRFNMVIRGLEESSQGTPRSHRVKYDNDLVLAALTKVDPSITPHCVRDCTRLGKYTESKNRLLLVKLNSSSTVTAVLSSKKALATLHHLSIQPDLSPEDRKKLSILLKERRKLIDEGTIRKDIKIKGNILILKGEKYGYTDGESFILEGAENERKGEAQNSSPPESNPNPSCTPHSGVSTTDTSTPLSQKN